MKSINGSEYLLFVTRSSCSFQFVPNHPCLNIAQWKETTVDFNNQADQRNLQVTDLAHEVASQSIISTAR
jgi:hypothetical protein